MSNLPATLRPGRPQLLMSDQLPEHLQQLEEYGPEHDRRASPADARKLIHGYITHLDLAPEDAFERLIGSREGDHLWELEQQGRDAQGWFEREWAKVSETIHSSPLIRTPGESRRTITDLADAALEPDAFFWWAYGPRDKEAYFAILKLAWKLGRTNPRSSDKYLAKQAGMTAKRFRAARKVLGKAWAPEMEGQAQSLQTILHLPVSDYPSHHPSSPLGKQGGRTGAREGGRSEPGRSKTVEVKPPTYLDKELRPKGLRSWPWSEEVKHPRQAAWKAAMVFFFIPGRQP